MKSTNFIYKKASKRDIKEIAKLVTELLGTCNLNPKKTIMQNNIDEISEDINNYVICTNGIELVGACGISNILKNDRYNLNLKNIREILYLVVNPKYQGMGVGTKLLDISSRISKEDIIYEAWGDNEKYVNSKFVLEKCGYILYKDLGNDYYKNHDYCNKCVNRNKECNECLTQIYIKKYKRK